jgi:hypothetical protein
MFILQQAVGAVIPSTSSSLPERTSTRHETPTVIRFRREVNESWKIKKEPDPVQVAHKSGADRKKRRKDKSKLLSLFLLIKTQSCLRRFQCVLTRNLLPILKFHIGTFALSFYLLLWVLTNDLSYFEGESQLKIISFFS